MDNMVNRIYNMLVVYCSLVGKHMKISWQLFTDVLKCLLVEVLTWYILNPHYLV